MPDLGALVSSPLLTDPEGLRWLAFLLLQPNLTTLYEYSLDLGHSATIALCIIANLTRLPRIILEKNVPLCII